MRLALLTGAQLRVLGIRQIQTLHTFTPTPGFNLLFQSYEYQTMARTKGGQMARKFVGIGDSLSASDADDVEGEVRADEGGDVSARAGNVPARADGNKRCGVFIVGKFLFNLCLVSKTRKRKEPPTYQELIDRLDRKRESDRVGAKK